jgi:hypothetical protein
MSLDPTLGSLGLLALKIENEQATSGLEHASNFSKSLTFTLSYGLPDLHRPVVARRGNARAIWSQSLTWYGNP